MSYNISDYDINYKMFLKIGNPEPFSSNRDLFYPPYYLLLSLLLFFIY